MAWTYATPNPFGSAVTTGGQWDGVVDFSSYRTVNGIVEARLTDVSFKSGYQFSNFNMTLSLVSPAGIALATRQLSRTWGAQMPFTSFGRFAGARSVRFRIGGSSFSPGGAGGLVYDFTLQFRWDG